MTWNLENLFLPGQGSGGPQDEGVFEAKLSALAATINTAAPQILAVQEVGSPEAAQAMVERLDGEWEVVLSEHPDNRGIRVGVLSQFPIEQVENVVNFPSELQAVQGSDEGEPVDQMGRGALHARIRVESGAGSDEIPTIDLVCCHMKSKLITYPGGRFTPKDEDERARSTAYALYRRTAEATTLRTYANRLLARPDETDQEPAVVLCGDLNDVPQAATTQILLGPGGSEIGTPGFDRPDQGDAARLWNTAALIPEQRRYSRIYRNSPELIDHILVSHRLIHRIDTVDSIIDRSLPSIDDIPTARIKATDSDHAPITATLRL